MKLPSPTRERWQPLRGGLVNIYKYQDEEFWYEDGRLLLRGNNGTGKSRVLALQLPFLLDGEITPSRVEPDGDIAKRIEWNLHMDKFPERRGYTWIEFGRRDADGTEHFRTLGCGLHAVRGRGAPTRWFFLTPKRIGADLRLIENDRVLSKERLKAALGREGELRENAADWRALVDQTLFRLGARYDALLDLLLQLRQPQLSRTLDEERLSAALSTALAPLPTAAAEQLAEAFGALETDRSELDGFRAAEAAAGAFLERYRRYVSVAARRRAGAVRTSHAAYEHASRERLRAQEEREAADRARDVADAEQRAAETAFEDADVRLRTLEAAPEMDRARELDRAREDEKRLVTLARQAADEAHRAREAAARAEVQRAEGESRVDQDRRRAQTALDAAREKAVPVGLVDNLPEALGGTPDRPRWDRALSTRQQAVEHLRKAERALDAAAADRTRADERRAREEQAVDGAVDDERAAWNSHEAAGAAHLAAWRAWDEALVELALPEGMDAALADWAAEPEGPNPAAQAARDAHRAAAAALQEARQPVLLARGEADAARFALAAERERLLVGAHAPPAPHPARDATGRPHRPGAPLWRLVDFRASLAPAARAGLEAALEGAGLLDAWVTPDGALLPPGANDAALTAATAPVTPSLSDRLVPIESGGVSADIVAAVLARIGIAPAATADPSPNADPPPLWVSEDGRYALGPLCGAWSKAEAVHIGETAREAARAARLAAIAAELAALASRLAELDAALDGLAARHCALDRELGSQPSDEAVRVTAAALTTARDRVVQTRSRLLEAERSLAAARAVETERRDVRDAEARDLGLAAWVGRPSDLDAAMSALRTASAALWPTLDLFANGLRASRETTARAEDAAAEAARLGERDVAAAREAREAAVRRDTLEGLHGAEIAGILRAVEAAREEVGRARGRRDRANTGRVGAETRFVRFDESLRQAGELVERRAAAREHAVNGLSALDAADLLPVLDLPRIPGDWSVTRAVDLARTLEERLADIAADDPAWNRLQNQLFADVEELRKSLLPHRYEPTQRDIDGLLVVEVPFAGADEPIVALHRRLRDEGLTREVMLTARERQLLENHLVDDIAALLHARIHDAVTLVREMSAQVESRKTSTGMRLRFTWDLRDGADPAEVEARKRLLRTGATWGAEDRALLGAFLKARLDDARVRDPGGTWVAHIEQAFDYRKWHVFRVERWQDGIWKRLTRRSHGTGSGGEKAIALTMPQLAAAAAYYRNASPLAPRLILLDEAFVGIDTDMRAQCMGLLTAFDLDFLMTSEREWACYSTVPAVAICQLVTRPGIEAVDVVRWVWNGRERVRTDADPWS
jgi:uncharacterized protein (TIGR02680 family)